MSSVLRWIAASLYTITVTVFSFVSSRSLKEFTFNIPLEDKIGHMGIYGIYALILLWANESRNSALDARERKFPYLAVCMFCFAYGLLMECGQLAITSGDRQFETGDILANAIGAFAGTVVFKALQIHRSSVVSQRQAGEDISE